MSTTVAGAVGRTLAHLGCDRAFGVVGSGNFAVTNALVAGGAEFIAARHEGGAATMADAYARMSGRVGVLSVHQGCGLTNAMTGITEAAKSRTPLVVLAAEATSPQSNFSVDQPGLAAAVGALNRRVTAAGSAVEQTAGAFYLARDDRRTVLLNLPLDVQAASCDWSPDAVPVVVPPPPLEPRPDELARLVDALGAARAPVFVAGRGARAAREQLEALADRVGSLLATSAVSRGLFAGNPWSLDTSGGFASPLAAELIAGSDLIVGWGCALNMWTMRHGTLVGAGATLAQVDLDPEAIGRHRPVQVGVVGDVGATARAATEALESPRAGRRDDGTRRQIAERVRWRDVPFAAEREVGRVDPRSVTIALDDLLPAERVVAVDSGNFMGYPSMFLSVPDQGGMCFTQAYQSIGLGLATAVGAALARPDRLPVAALGDGGALMGISELETVARLRLPMVVIVYNDAAYGAEVHHFGPAGDPLDTVVFPDPDLASIARGFGLAAVTVRSVDDLGPVRAWLGGRRDSALLIDVKVTRDRPAWWLAEAFGH